MSLETTNFFLGLGTVALQVATAALFALYLFRERVLELRRLAEFVRAWALPAAFALSLSATALSLYYSEVLGVEPCPLCWWQRIFVYPQVILLGLALYWRDYGIAGYSIALSLVGAGFALYHHVLQVMPSGTLPCPAAAVSCAQRFVFEFGYVTLPLMGLSLFAALIVLMLFVRIRN
ncbi:disulfide bond formation protein B [Candidatus Kaiserbacteria bacterium]|nr:disulfide bond formation protein B [Candidatus Kaiserbacteria bacterium]